MSGVVFDRQLHLAQDLVVVIDKEEVGLDRGLNAYSTPNRSVILR
jgi:hypothetical protein